MEQRKLARLPIERTMLIQRGDSKAYQGKTTNISFGDAYINLSGHDDLRVNDECELVLQLDENLDSIEIFLKAKIVRIEQDGVAVQFASIMAENYRDFEQLLINASPDPIKLMAELDKHRGLDITHTYQRPSGTRLRLVCHTNPEYTH
ncbi:hypothetical protein MNBD_GAMMA26-1942 [hydrothermal vent metagenome]|uniref:PilZ domain-containing protein n=1 Tax=hydrothermal vent metagenome TaxID=652676 RepID=A0A3B1B4C7_9ZZZZ